MKGESLKENVQGVTNMIIHKFKGTFLDELEV